MTKTYKLCHTDTCLPDYFSGDSRPWLCIPAYPMTLDELKSQLKSVLNEGAIGGNLDWEERESEEFFTATKQAIDGLTLKDGLPADHIIFEGIEQSDDCDSVMAYFVFVEE